MNNENAQWDPVGQQEQQAFLKQRGEVGLSIEEVLLLVFGVFFVLYGLLLFPVLTGALRYSLDSADGLFLVIVSLQVITMGKTPFGDLRRSWILVIVGIALAMLGSLDIFTPGSLTVPVSILTGVILVVGGVSQLVQLFISEEKAKTWLKVPGILQHLTIACGVVWVLGVLLGILTLSGVVAGNVVLVPGNPAGPLVAVLLLSFGLSFFYLTWCIQKVTRSYPPQETKNSAREQMTSENPPSQDGFSVFRGASLSLTDAFGLFRGVLITFIGLLYYGVYFGGMPLNQSGRLGLLLILTSLILLWEGLFLGRQYRRSWWLMTIGIVFAGMGIISCIVPGILADVIQPLLGLQNILREFCF